MAAEVLFEARTVTGYVENISICLQMDEPTANYIKQALDLVQTTTDGDDAGVDAPALIAGIEAAFGDASWTPTGDTYCEVIP